MFLTVKEASDITGKSATTIYRLCNKRRNSSFIKKEDNKFFIDKEFLLATYPQEEKRIIEIIENGSKEMGEPVFLEIEPKQSEKLIEDQNNDEIKEIISDGIPSNILLKSAKINDFTDIKTETIADSGIINSIESKITNQTIDATQIPIYHKRKFWEGFIGLSVIVLALISLLVLFYLNGN